MTHAELLTFLWDHGHFRNPALPDLHNVRKEDVPQLAETDKEARLAVQSYQEYFVPLLDEISMAIHGRLSQTDGDAGPATRYLVEKVPRCHHPDFDVPDDEVLAPLWSRQEANIPTGCRGEILIGRDFAALPGLTKEETDAVYWALCHNWTEALQDVVMTPANDQIGDPTGTIFYHRLERMRGGTLAYHYLARNRCERLDGAWNSLVKWTRRLGVPVGGHEVCHGCGSNHNNDPNSLMFPSITNAAQNRLGYPNATDIAAMKALGYRPYDNWQERQLPEGRLFLPRDAVPDDPSLPDPDLAERVRDLEEKAFGNLVTDAAQDARLTWAISRIEELEKALEGK